MKCHEPIEWSAELETGVREIDEQHRVLVSLLNDAAGTEMGERCTHKPMEPLLRDLLAYAIYHFETEEKLMASHAYDAAEPEAAREHRQQHREFSRRVVEMRAGMRKDEEAYAALVEFLMQWLLNHILKCDRQLTEFILLREKRVAE